MDLTPTLPDLGSDGVETPVIRRRITALVWLDKAQERRYYRPHSGRWIQPAHFFLKELLIMAIRIGINGFRTDRTKRLAGIAR